MVTPGRPMADRLAAMTSPERDTRRPVQKLLRLPPVPETQAGCQAFGQVAGHLPVERRRSPFDQETMEKVATKAETYATSLMLTLKTHRFI
jgi:hypothetical protein